jgi:hypothetical protein
MVLLVPGNANPTMDDIDKYLLRESHTGIKRVVREIHCKSGASALLHPAEKYFLEKAQEVLRSSLKI